MHINLTSAARSDKPFPYFASERAISETMERDLLTWLEREAPWRLAVMDFYEQYEFDFANVSLPPTLQPMVSQATIDLLRADLERLLGGKLTSQVDITAHKLNRTQKIRIHNDARPDGETHRFLIQLNREWSESRGGLLMLFRGPEVEMLENIIRPVSGSAFGFRISGKSYHAVSQVREGDRYTLVFSFYEDRLVRSM